MLRNMEKLKQRFQVKETFESLKNGLGCRTEMKTLRTLVSLTLQDSKATQSNRMFFM